MRDIAIIAKNSQFKSQKEKSRQRKTATGSVFLLKQNIISNCREGRQIINRKKMEKLYTVEELATILKINKQTLLRFLREGKISFLKVGREYRIPENSINDYLKLSPSKIDKAI